MLSAAKRLQALDDRLARETYLEALAAAISCGRRDALVEVAQALPAGWPIAAPACRRAPDDRLGATQSPTGTRPGWISSALA